MSLSTMLKTAARTITTPIVPLIAKSRISPDMLTWTGFCLAIATCWVLAAGHLFTGGILVLVSGMFDMLDGALARYTGKNTRFGAFLDSTIDRLCEALILFGLSVYFLKGGSAALFMGSLSADNETLIAIVLIIVVLTFSFLTSYTRARAEGLGIECQVGIFPRSGRVIVLALGLLFNVVLWALLIIALLAVITVIQRMVHVWKSTRGSV